MREQIIETEKSGKKLRIVNYSEKKITAAAIAAIKEKFNELSDSISLKFLLEIIVNEFSPTKIYSASIIAYMPKKGNPLFSRYKEWDGQGFFALDFATDNDLALIIYLAIKSGLIALLEIQKNPKEFFDNYEPEELTGKAGGAQEDINGGVADYPEIGSENHPGEAYPEEMSDGHSEGPPLTLPSDWDDLLRQAKNNAE